MSVVASQKNCVAATKQKHSPSSKIASPNATNAASVAPWKVQASTQAINTSNPIREIIETMNLAENPSKKVIPLSIGDPTIFGNLKPCKQILEALQSANSCGKYYGYQTAAGMETARDAVAEYHNKCTGNRVKRQDVILASGCSHAIDLCICVLARSGQNILIPRPGFPLYKTLTSVYGVQYKQYDLLADQNWSIDLKHLESLIDENTAAIVINNPSNPCGSVFSKKHLMQILELAERHRKPIIADEIYDKFVFAPELYGQHTLKQQHQNLETNGNQNDQQALNLCRNLEYRQPKKVNGRGDQENLIAEVEPELDCESCAQQLKLSLIKDNVHSEHESRDGAPKLALVKGRMSSISETKSVNGSRFHSEGESGEKQELIDGEAPFYVPFISLSSLSKTVPILTCGGISKTCLIPGLRLGWIIVNDKQGIFDESVRNGLSRLTQRLMGPNSLVQGALADILNTVPEAFYKQTMDFIFKNAKLCYERLSKVKGLQPHMPQGSMYLMVRFEAKSFPSIDGDLDFTSKLMNEESVLVLPGKCFDFPNYFRICLTVPTNVMDEALDRMSEFCSRHHIDNSTGKLKRGIFRDQTRSDINLSSSSDINGHPNK